MKIFMQYTMVSELKKAAPKGVFLYTGAWYVKHIFLFRSATERILYCKHSGFQRGAAKRRLYGVKLLVPVLPMITLHCECSHERNVFDASIRISK